MASASTSKQMVTEKTHDMVIPVVTSYLCTVQEFVCTCAWERLWPGFYKCLLCEYNMWFDITHTYLRSCYRRIRVWVHDNVSVCLAVCAHVPLLLPCITASEKRCHRILFCHCLSVCLCSLQPQGCHNHRDNKQLMTGRFYRQLFLFIDIKILMR